MKAFHMVNVYMDRKVKFRMKLFKKLKEKMNRYLERVAKENNELFDGGVPDCCKLNQNGIHPRRDSITDIGSGLL